MALIRVGSWNNRKREGKVYLTNKKWLKNVEWSMRREAYNIRFKQKLK